MKARMGELTALEIGILEWNGKVVGPMTRGDLTEDEIVAGEIDKN